MSNTIFHHPPDDMLLSYVGGALDTGFSLCIAAHVNMCPHCQQSTARLQSIGGAVLAAQDPEPMLTSAADLLSRAIKDTPQLPVIKSTTQNDNLPAPLGAYLDGPLESLKWQKLGPGLRQHMLKLDGKSRARLIWIDTGRGVPMHRHTGDEFTLVLSGGYFCDETPFTKGDIQYADIATHHQPIAMDDGPCLTLAATNSPLRFDHLVPRLLQPFFKI